MPTGTITFTDATANNGAGAVIGTETLNTHGAATLTTSTLSPGTHSITASYSGDANYVGSISQGAQISIIAMTLSPGSSTATVAPGQSTSAIPISFSTNPISTVYYYAPVTLTCSGLPAGATCAFTPDTFLPNDTAASGAAVLSGSSLLTIYTKGPTLQQAENSPPPAPWAGLGTLTLAGLLGLGFRRRWRRLFASLSVIVLLVFCLGLGGCGGKYNISNPGTTAGTYTVTITGTMVDGPCGTFTKTKKWNLTVTAPEK